MLVLVLYCRLAGQVGISIGLAKSDGFWSRWDILGSPHAVQSDGL